VIAFGPFRLFAAERLIERSGKPLQLGGRAMDILIALVERAGEVVSQRDLIDRVWPNVTVDDGNLRFNIAALRKSLGDGQHGARYVINVPGRGYCFVSPTTRLPRVESPPAPTELLSTTYAIPSRLKRMVGRGAAVEAISAQLADSRFVTIVGPGGIGKTTVAISIGHSLAANYGVVCFVDLGPVADPLLVPSVLATALGLVVQSEDLIPSLIGFLREKRMLLVLDSCEHVIEAAARLAQIIFEQAGDVHILATSREALRIEGEHVHRLAPLDCPPAGAALTAAESLTFSAVQLFTDRVSAASDRFVFRDADAPVVARICCKLDGIALAIELAAGRVDAYGVEGVDALLDSRLSLLWQGRRAAPPRHYTLSATLDWSYNLLAETERATLRRLVVFAGAFGLEAAQAVARRDDVDEDAIVESIASLVAKSLIVSHADRGEVRYSLLATTRAYLREKLANTGELQTVARHHAEFFCRFLERIGAKSTTFSETRGFGAYGEHLGNVRAALEWCFSDRGDVRLGIILAAAAAPLFLEMSLLTECRRWTQRALEAHADAVGHPRCEMELRASLGLSLMFTEGNGAAVLTALTRALDLAEGLGELGQQLRLIGCLNQFHYRIGDFRGAVALAERALDVARKMADPTGLAVAEWMLGTSHHMAGNQTSAVLYCRGALQRPGRTSLADFMRHGLDHRIRALCALMRAQWLCGHADEATDTARYTLPEAEALEGPVTLSVTLICMAFVFLWIGNLSEAEAIIERATSHTKKHSLTPYHAVAVALRGELAVRRGEAAAAIPILMDCLQTMRSRRYLVQTPAFASDLAEALAMTGRLDEALATIEGEISQVKSIDESFDMPEMLRLKGVFLAMTNTSNLTAAEDCFRHSLDLARRQGALSLELRTAMAMARLRADQGRRAAARDELAPVYARFTQGMETFDLRAARNLLDSLD